jgi:hypothetical protein
MDLDQQLPPLLSLQMVLFGLYFILRFIEFNTAYLGGDPVARGMTMYYTVILVVICSISLRLGDTLGIVITKKNKGLVVDTDNQDERSRAHNPDGPQMVKGYERPVKLSDLKGSSGKESGEQAVAFSGLATRNADSSNMSNTQTIILGKE